LYHGYKAQFTAKIDGFIFTGDHMASPSVWRLIYTKPRQEMEAQRQLERQGYTTYLPILCRHTRRHGKRIEVQSPLFPRYLFIHLTPGIDDWGPVRSTRGVSRLVKFGTEAVSVPDELIAEIKSRAEEDGYHYEDRMEFVRGDSVRISEGPFSGYEAIFQASRGEDRVLVLLDVIGQTTKVEVSTDSISSSS
jgi:transcriptional antiterminator RfaH